MQYDYVIIGAGPTGLTLAWYLSKYNKKILLIDREESMGGCHRVKRVNGLLSEHGPRIIINNYFSLIDILKDMNIKFDDVFVKYDFSVNTTVNKLLSLLTIKELLAFLFEFIKFSFNEDVSRHVTMYEFASKYNFNKKAIEYIDTICRVSDGGTIKNYTLFEFFQIFNQNIFYDIYQPKLPNDVGLFSYWEKALKKNNVDIILNTEIKSIISNKYLITTKNKKITGKNYIFAIPPQPMLNIIKRSSNKNMFGNINELIDWELKSRYLVYIPINFHWNTKVQLKHVQGVTESEYGLGYIIMSNYMNFNDERSKTVITCTVKNTNVKSSFNNKTANECNKEELIQEVFRQLNIHQPFLPEPTYSILSPGVYKNKNRWDTIDTAYFYTKAGYKPNKSVYKNLYWVGTHNGNSNYSFTAMESAMENAISLLHDLEPKNKNDVVIRKSFTVKQFMFMVFVIIGIYLFNKKKN
jgi:UDP-galactopyranose mutase